MSAFAIITKSSNSSPLVSSCPFTKIAGVSFTLWDISVLLHLIKYFTLHKIQNPCQKSISLTINYIQFQPVSKSGHSVRLRARKRTNYCLVVTVQRDMKLERNVYEVLQIRGISLTDKTHLCDLFDKSNFKILKTDVVQVNRIYLVF